MDLKAEWRIRERRDEEEEDEEEEVVGEVDEVLDEEVSRWNEGRNKKIGR